MGTSRNDNSPQESLAPAMLEVENKYRLFDWTRVRAMLVEWGAHPQPLRKDTDHYFNAPDRDFALTGEAFRLRRMGTMNKLTYKGPKRAGTTTKTRLELELCVGEGPDAATTAVKMLHGLGYVPVAVVTKHREVLKFYRAGFAFEACLDDVGTVGRFVELEILTPEETYPQAEAALIHVAAELGLTDLERKSYLELLVLQPKSGTIRVGTGI